MKKKAVNPKDIKNHLYLYEFFIKKIFNDCSWTTLSNEYKRNSDGTINANSLKLRINKDYLNADELEILVKNIEEYEATIKLNFPDFELTDFQFFPVLFTEIMLSKREEIRQKFIDYLTLIGFQRKTEIGIIDEREDNIFSYKISAIINEIIRKNKDKAGYKDEINKGGNVKEVLRKYFDFVLIDDYTANFNRIAYYMATGAGKTHILHINYLQAKRYFESANYYIIVPTSELGKQHLEKLRIFAPFLSVGFIQESSNKKSKNVARAVEHLLQDNQNHIKILTVYQLNAVLKLYETEKYNPFKGTNIVFVDEGHKGATKVKGWRKDRDALIGERGFCFEYSATFPQAIKDNNELLQEYSKSIIFKYPYSQFRQEKYGKNPNFDGEQIDLLKKLINKKNGKKEEEIKIDRIYRWKLFLKQILSFYQQVDSYNKLKSEEDSTFDLYGFEHPLCFFVGHSVASTNKTSSVREIIEFFERFTKNENNEVKNQLKDLIPLYIKDDTLSIESSTSNQLLNKLDEKTDKVYQGIFEEIFNSQSISNLEIFKINDKELGLKITGSDKYFGVVYVGDAKSIGIDAPEDKHYSTLIEPFLKGKGNEWINVVISARLLAEGWDTYRISNIGLVDIGKEEGSLVVQLFGRGIRLRGKADARLKRSSEEKYSSIETLKIFGYDASYLKKFIEENDIEDEAFGGIREIKIVCEVNNKLLSDKKIIKTNYIEPPLIWINPKDDKTYNQLLKRVSYDFSDERDSYQINLKNFVNYPKLYERLFYDNKYSNICFTYNQIKELADKLFSKEVKLRKDLSIKNIRALNDIAYILLKRYIDLVLDEIRKQEEFKNAFIEPIDEKDDNILYEYTFRGNAGKINSLISAGILDKKDKGYSVSIYRKDNIEAILPHSEEVSITFAIKIDRHIYVPIMVDFREKLGVAEKEWNATISPDSIVESELNFLRLFDKYVKSTNKDIVILRNRKKVGFHSFYPDFIMWYRYNDVDTITFLDPKGFDIHDYQSFWRKVLFSLRIKELENKIREKHNNIQLFSYILYSQDKNMECNKNMEYMKMSFFYYLKNTIELKNIDEKFENESKLIEFWEHLNFIQLNEVSISKIVNQIERSIDNPKEKDKWQDFLKTKGIDTSNLLEFIADTLLPDFVSQFIPGIKMLTDMIKHFKNKRKESIEINKLQRV